MPKLIYIAFKMGDKNIFLVILDLGSVMGFDSSFSIVEIFAVHNDILLIIIINIKLSNIITSTIYSHLSIIWTIS